MRSGTRGFVVCVLLMMVCGSTALAVGGAQNSKGGNHDQSVLVEWYYKWDGTGDRPDYATPFHVYTLIQGQTTSRRITEVTDWDYVTVYRTDGTSFRRFVFIEYGSDVWTETLWKGKYTYDDFPYNDFDNTGDPWDPYPDT